MPTRDRLLDWDRRLVWHPFTQMAEDNAPFNIDVTTVNPWNFNNQQALRVVIGGSAFDWYQTPTTEDTSGTSSASSFTDGSPSVVYVFSGSIREWTTVNGTDGDGQRLQHRRPP